MTRRIQFGVIVVSVVALASLAGHAVVKWVGIGNRSVMHTTFGTNSAPTALVQGSSITYDGIAWNRFANLKRIGMESWAVAGSTPSEWSELQARSPQVKLTFVGISPYDLNEHSLCDFRPNIVPITQTITDLWESKSDPQFAKRVLSTYALRYLRRLFPTAGRSEAVLVGLRKELRKLIGRNKKSDAAAPVFHAGEEFTSNDKVSSWPEDKKLRRVSSMRNICQGKQAFDGPKKLALYRFLERARHMGRVVVLVAPVSPVYRRHLLSTKDLLHYERAISEAQTAFPEVRWVRLDRIKALDSEDLFYDLVHLNMDGREIATEAFLAEVNAFSATP